MSKDGLAGRVRRLKAYFTDIVVLGVAVFLGIILFGINGEEKNSISLLYFLTFPIIVIALQLNLLFNHSQTLGKVNQNIVIVDSESGLRAGFGKNLSRIMLSLMMTVIPGMWLIDIVCILGKKRKCIHDSIAKTIVVDETYVTTVTPVNP
jgi:uncharacterized RDD family membrane protein YckC